jgi:hypothetical protein
VAMCAVFDCLRRSAGCFPQLPAFALALLTGFAWSSLQAGELNFSTAGAPIIYADWQDPSMLPPRFRNHCRFDPYRGRYLCSDHCGLDYQFYYCSQGSFGCCRTGYGYCGWDGLLRCAP